VQWLASLLNNQKDLGSNVDPYTGHSGTLVVFSVTTDKQQNTTAMAKKISPTKDNISYKKIASKDKKITYKEITSPTKNITSPTKDNIYKKITSKDKKITYKEITSPTKRYHLLQKI
jgi:hypothetical protein